MIPNTTQAKMIPTMPELRALPQSKHFDTLRHMADQLSEITGLRVSIQRHGLSYFDLFFGAVQVALSPERISRADFYGMADMLRMCLIVATFSAHKATNGGGR